MKQEYFTDLEFDKLLEIVAGYCFTEEGRRKVLSLRPFAFTMKYSDAIQMVNYRHSVISKARLICSHIRIPSIPYEIVEIWKKASKEGSIILPKQIYEIYEFLRSFRELVLFIDNLSDEFEVLKELVEIDLEYFYEKFGEIEDVVRRSIDRDGAILRSASTRLDKILSEKERIETTVVRLLTNFVNEPENEEFLQEKFVTIRNNRFVIPVKMGYINAIDGFVQDISSTGHTAFIEPRFVQSYTVRYLELIDEERREVERILREITSRIGEISELADSIVEIIGRFDEIQALARYANTTNSNRPRLSSKPVVKLIDARHPFLRDPVPITVEIGDGEESFGGLIISGPNTSGKTVSIKTLGLLTVMALSGMLIPASGDSVIGYFDKILTDIGDSQSIEKNLSTFSAHIARVNEIVALADRNSLVILDELGTGTDPREGEALAVAILRFLSEKKAKIAVATHYALVKKLPLSCEYFRNAYMEFDGNTLKPLYRVVFGMPGSSNAILIASKLGLKDEIVQNALRVMVEGVDVYEKFVIEVQNERREIQKLKEELKEKIDELEKLRKEYKVKISELEEKLEKIRRKEVNSLLSDIYEAKTLVSKIRERLISEKVSQKELESMNQELMRVDLEMREGRRVSELVKVKEPKIGDRVLLGRFGQEGTISKIYGDGKVEVHVGKLKMITDVSDLFEP
ncbi:MAG: MutS2/Smr-associated SH3 domain-containing protein [Brevinematia bacterium]